MSSLLDRANAMAYASEGRHSSDCDCCNAPPDPFCSVCRADGIDISEDGLCAECAPTEEETCEDYAARVRKIKSTCLCTAPATSPVSVPTGRCPIHGFAWRYPR